MPFIITDPTAITGHKNPVDREVLIRKLRRMVTGTRELDDDRPPCVGTGNGTILFDLVDPASPAQTWTVTYRIGTLDWEIVGSIDGIIGVVASDATFNNNGTADPVALRVTTGSVAFVNADKFTVITSNNVIDNTSPDRWVPDLTAGGYNFDTSDFYISRLADIGQAIRMVQADVVARDSYNILFQMAIDHTAGGGGSYEPIGWPDRMYHMTWLHTARYYIVFNDRRIVFVTEFAGKYFCAYLGLFLPFGTPGQYPNPMLCGATNLGMDRSNWKWHDNYERSTPQPEIVGDPAPLPRNGRNGLFCNNKYGARFFDELDVRNYVHGKPSVISETAQQKGDGNREYTQVHQDFDQVGGIWPWSGIDEGQNMTRASTGNHMAIQGAPSTTHSPQNETVLSDDGYMLVPGILYRDDSASGGIANVTGDVLGQLDGVYWVSGWRNLPENRGTFGGVDYVCFPDPFRPGALSGWWALRLD